MPRLTTIPLPTSRFIPGHANSAPRPPHTPPLSPDWSADPKDWRESQDYLWGIDLFNAGFSWESHEAFETPWKQLRARPSPDSIRAAHALQAIIQIAAARLKHEVSNPRGIQTLLTRASTNAAHAAGDAPVMGLNFNPWFAAATEWFANPTPQFPFLDPSEPRAQARGHA